MYMIVVTGSRGWGNWSVIENALAPYVELYGSDDIVLVHGDARGADKMSAWVAKNKLGVPTEQVIAVPAEWNKYGRSAGMRRNKQMLEMLQKNEDTGTVIAFWDGESRGTSNTINTAKEMGLPCRIFRSAVVEEVA